MPSKSCAEWWGGPTNRQGANSIARHCAKFARATAVIATILIFFAASSFAETRTTRLNENGLAYAGELIAQRRVVFDKRNDWGDHHPTARQENDFMHEHGFPEYSRWYLGIDGRHGQNSKARFKFPFGDFTNIHRCALIAVKSRAHQYGYSDIEDAAERLLKMMEELK